MIDEATFEEVLDMAVDPIGFAACFLNIEAVMEEYPVSETPIVSLVAWPSDAGAHVLEEFHNSLTRFKGWAEGFLALVEEVQARVATVGREEQSVEQKTPSSAPDAD